MTEPGFQPANVWTLHSELAGRPALCGWAKSQPEAEAKLAERQLKARAGETFWLVQLTANQVEELKHTGFLPKDA